MVHHVFEGVGIVVLTGLHAHQTGRHIGAVVGDTLRIVQHIQEDNAGINGAGTVFQALDVLVAQTLHQNVNDLLQRLYLAGHTDILIFKGIHGQGQDVLQGRVQDPQLILGGLTERSLFFFQLLRFFHDVDSIVANALVLGDKVQQLGHFVALVVVQLLISHLDEVVGDFHLHPVNEVFPHIDGADRVRVHLEQQRGSQRHIAGRAAGHLDHRVLGLLQGHSRALEQTLVQHRHTELLLLFFAVRHREHRQLGEHTAAGQEKQHGRHTGKGVDVCNGALIHYVAPHGDANGIPHQIDSGQQNDTADDVKVKMDEGCALAILGRAANGEQRGERRANVRAQNDGDG